MVLNNDEQEISQVLYHLRMVSSVKSARFRVAMVPFVSNSLAVCNNFMGRLGFRDEVNPRPRHYYLFCDVVGHTNSNVDCLNLA